MKNTSNQISHLRPTNLENFYFGATYYPEHWDAETRKNDPDLMSEAGFNIVRMAEFAWILMEPEEGRYDFSFFDEAIEKLGRKKIFTMLCTPTAAPPVWLVRKHPEILRVNDNGVSMRHGSRQHACHSNPIFMKYSEKITEAMAGHFKNNPFVVGWQTDNEFNCHFSECHCESCQAAFRKFLRSKYENIDFLNERWGTVFWGQTYSSFDEIQTPRNLKPAYPNPSQQLDYYRFISATVTEFQYRQVEILRKTQKKWFVTHNGIFGHIDYRGQFGKDLDSMGYDTYPMFENRPEFRRFSHAFGLDIVRSLTGNFMVLEHQSGPGGQAPYMHNNPFPGEIRAMTYKSISRGADGLLYFRWRTCRFGAEEYWCGILDHDNIPRGRYFEIRQIGNELKKIGCEVLGTSVHIDCAVAAGEMDVTDAHATYTLGLPSEDHIAGIIHRFLMRKGYAVGCVHPEDELSGLKLYVIPHWALFKPEWVPNLERFVKNGGTLVVSARTAAKNVDNTVVPDTLPGCLRNLCGVTVEEYGRLNLPAENLEMKIANFAVKPDIWYEILRPENGAVPYAKWKGGHLDGKCAISLKKHGRGHVFYIGTYMTEIVAPILIPKLANFAKISPLWKSPGKVEVVLRKNGRKKLWFFINMGEKKANLKNTPSGKNLITGKNTGGKGLSLPAYGVAVIKSLVNIH